MVFDEWWFKYGLDIDGIEKNEACIIWCAALNNAEALKPSHNNARDEICAEIMEYSEAYQYKLDLGAHFSKGEYLRGILDVVKRKLSPVA